MIDPMELARQLLMARMGEVLAETLRLNRIPWTPEGAALVPGLLAQYAATVVRGEPEGPLPDQNLEASIWCMDRLIEHIPISISL